MADGCSIDVVPCDLPQHLMARKRHLATNMGEPAMRWNEGQPFAISPQYAKNSDVHPVLQILLAKIFGDRPFLADCTDIELLAGAERQLAL